ncbi:MaoC/PaaZ C-terminal domain-containing protein [Demequina sp. B12]|uniref:MaoC/PaaZ C-terminal domain-containing protein n=1 Tax=Demequina sp. B12 TaxID=2992757 RepID=UPI00237A9783|nr:MaoC/PaaZ C-terminal domain-containing protein [Demequina sp. B12]MDE0573134.1 MaoC/PaaZ C-terminal domain-containing protein [Demequina sp. B12]
MTTLTLDQMPSMGAGFARALMPSRRTQAALPKDAVTVPHLRQDSARLADYARVCGFTLRDTVPATWLHVLTFPLHVHLLGDPAASVRLMGAIHVSNSMTLHHEVHITDPLAVTVHANNLRAHKRGTLVDLNGAISVDDQMVWEGTSTYLASGVTTPGDPVEISKTPFVPHTPHATWRLPATLGRDYRRVSGDPNPIHTHTIAAKSFGFPRPIIHGMWTHARALAALEGRIPSRHTVNVDFVKPVFLPSSVGFQASADDQGVHAAVTSKDGSKPHLLMTVTEALMEHTTPSDVSLTDR